ncbi:unnamed protein product [Lymnaea stagnalis]|uniref:AIG1-type G domain-containing protein n=1 Tax=Lymnaea stagnalis TaxID=6523 RepID=A0AAV2HFP7_LYMST
MSRQISLFVAGRTGNGNSATCNSILNRRAFRSAASATSMTRKICHEYGQINGETIHVVNGPGIGYSSLDRTSADAVFLTEIKIAVALNPSGFDAVIITVKFGERFTQEDQDAIAMLKNVFGKELLKKHCVIVMTGGDIFERESDETGRTFREWLDQQHGRFKELLEECGHRIVLFDNLTEDEEVKDRQVKELMGLVQDMVDNGPVYTNEMFEAAIASRDRILEESDLPLNFGDLLREVGLILHSLKLGGSNEDEDQHVAELGALSGRCQDLSVRTSSADSGTGKLQTITLLVDFCQRCIRNNASRISRLRREREACDRTVEESARRHQHEVINEDRARELDIDVHPECMGGDEQMLAMTRDERDARSAETFTRKEAIREWFRQMERRERAEQSRETAQLEKHYWEVKGQWDTWMVSEILKRTSQMASV